MSESTRQEGRGLYISDTLDAAGVGRLFNESLRSWSAEEAMIASEHLFRWASRHNRAAKGYSQVNL
jgi:hypothetical protein